MSLSKELRFKRLRKARIWPSVLFFLLTIGFSLLLFASTLIASLLFYASERVSGVLKNGQYDANNISAMIQTGHSDQLPELINRLPSANGAALLVDADGNILCGFGEPTYAPDFNSLWTSAGNDSYMIAPDIDLRENIFQPDGKLDLTLTMNHMEYFSNDAIGYDDILYRAGIWSKHEMPDGTSLLIRHIAPLYRKDFENSYWIGVISFFGMMFPAVFFFFNLIGSIRTQRRMTRLLYTDNVTGHRNYFYYENKTAPIFRRFTKLGQLYLVADITLMKYRSYCSYHGVKAGENLLEEIDRQLCSYLNKKEICAHTGKASFVLFLKCANRKEGETRIRTMLEEIPKKLDMEQLNFHAGLFFTDLVEKEKTDPSTCYNRASAARAMLSDENVTDLAIYDNTLLEQQLWEHKVEEKMQAALDNEEFHVYIQPKYNPVTDELAGAEALVRWINDEDGFIPPGRFIPIFEKDGFITKLDDYMISHVAKLQAEWLKEGKKVVPVSVNVSRAHFSNPQLAKHLCDLVDAYNLPHNLLEIELTESAFFDDKKLLLKTVHELGDLGFEVSMDDFGAGYSSLNSLKDLPLDVLKLDADFFRGEDTENRGEIVVSQAISLAKKLDMRIVAEGVEKKEQVDFLASQGCDMIQGYYYAKPMPADEYAERLTRGTAVPISAQT